MYKRQTFFHVGGDEVDAGCWAEDAARRGAAPDAGFEAAADWARAREAALLRASAGADKLDDADEDGLFWGAATVAYDAALPDAGAPACTDKAHWEYVGWAPLARGAALAKLRAASDDAFARGEDGAILAYVHGFNTVSYTHLTLPTKA